MDINPSLLENRILFKGPNLEIIEPCGFLFSDKRFKRVVMDYMDNDQIKFFKNYTEFFRKKKN